MDETINFTEKVAPFINPDLMLQKEAFTCLHEMRMDRYNYHVLHKFLLNFGDIHLTQVNGDGMTTIQAELQREFPSLLEMVMEASNSILT